VAGKIVKLIHAASELGNGTRKVCLAIGVFDGVHLGHQQIIRQTIADARQHDAVALIVTFDQHPNAIVAPDRNPPQIFSRSQKIRAIQSLGADALLEIPFDKKFSEKSGEVFIRELARDLGKIFSICVGADFVFGNKRSGNVALLKKLGAEIGFQVHGHAAVALDGEMVSSTRIREAIRAGHLDAASQMLGRPYAMCGSVLAGDKIGHQLGFPTANLDAAKLILPPNGVYAGCTRLDGKFFRVALNIGLRPTVAAGKPELRVEAHLLDFSGDLYGGELEVEIGAKLRDEKKFSSAGELKAQIARDVAAVRAA
jgi:riboflavin kinase/FMN adenylyltransferase